MCYVKMTLVIVYLHLSCRMNNVYKCAYRYPIDYLNETDSPEKTGEQGKMDSPEKTGEQGKMDGGST